MDFQFQMHFPMNMQQVEENVGKTTQCAVHFSVDLVEKFRISR